MGYIEWFSEAFQGCTSERAYVIPLGPWGMSPAVFLGEGFDHRVSIHPLAVMQALQRAQARRGVVGHRHVTTSPPLPSTGDLYGAALLSSRLKAEGMTLADFVIGNTDGRMFSFAAHGLLGDPVQTASKFPFRWWGINSTLSGRHQLDEPPRPHSGGRKLSVY